MARCVCGFTHSHIPHDCWRNDIKQGTRCEVKPHCKCGFLHPHIPHDCSTFPEKPAEAQVKLNECPVCGPRQVTDSKTLTPKEDLDICSEPCFVKLGYTAEDYPNFLEFVAHTKQESAA